MGKVSKIFSEELIAAEQAWRAAEHVLEITFPSIRDPKLLLRVIVFLEKAIKKTISLILKLEHIEKNLELTKSGSKNMSLFFDSVGSKYGLSPEDLEALKDVFDLGNKYRQSALAFSNKGRAVLFDDDLGEIIISYEHLEKLSKSVRKLQMAFRGRLRGVEKYK